MSNENMGDANMSESKKATQRLVVAQLETMSDSQFLGYVALVCNDVDGPMWPYIARRIDLIALRIGAYEAKEGDDERSGQ